jgi:hypothetical protein
MYSPYYRQARPPDQPGQQRRFNKIQFSGHTPRRVPFLGAESALSCVHFWRPRRVPRTERTVPRGNRPKRCFGEWGGFAGARLATL